MRTAILCGGRGTRAHPLTAEVPKPLLEVAGRPVLGHLMQIYAAQGFTDFVLAAGHRIDKIREFAANLPSAWAVEVVDTGPDANTAARVASCRSRLGQVFFLTYGDGLGDIDLAALLEHHGSHGAAVTLTTVPLPSPYGTLALDDDVVVAFNEKPTLDDHPINAGFFVLDDRAFDHWVGDDLERDVLPALSAAGELRAYRHPGFWRSLDTYKDAVELSELAEPGPPPWLVAPGPHPPR